MKIAHLSIPLILGLIGPVAALAEAPPTLRASVTITSELVRLGDLVDNAGRFSDVAVFRSPDMGHTGSVPAWRILDAAKRMGLARIETGDQTDVSVTRAARVVPLADMEERIAAAIARSLGIGDSARIAVTFDRGIRPIAVEPNVRGELSVARIDHDPRTGRFEALLGVHGSALAERGGGFRVTGQAAELVEYVVPARAIGRGEVIKTTDLTVERRPRNELNGVPGDAISSLTQAVGQAARRPLQAERPFRATDLMKPEIVERNGNVLIIYEVAGLSLTIRGKAMEAGAEGDIVQVQNLATRKTMQATVSGLNRVTVVQRPSITTLSAATPSQPSVPTQPRTSTQ
ncbi:flagellar basal body P-ring formation chaperone FlgA [Phreatobacter stygius]|uniref:Flagellar basal body P-ring formation protein FlgA n=1 Tax=Phreatobacter stygius TaxID=1940610 RepID=A0A4D7APT4_9HYPH|nr:flagellar basal body P-ring formation chaperone FlgA [Phreatobacter stygius]QCI62999.1 flagellar basal body P-ring formation protein FlgA [Phreatobacter stygius]